MTDLNMAITNVIFIFAQVARRNLSKYIAWQPLGPICHFLGNTKTLNLSLSFAPEKRPFRSWLASSNKAHSKATAVNSGVQKRFLSNWPPPRFILFCNVAFCEGLKSPAVVVYNLKEQAVSSTLKLSSGERGNCWLIQVSDLLHRAPKSILFCVPQGTDTKWLGRC